MVILSILNTLNVAVVASVVSNQHNNIVSLLQNEDTMAQLDPLKIGDYRMGRIGTDFYILKDNWLLTLKSKKFPEAVKEAYEEACAHCKSLGLPNPPKPA